MQLPPLQVEPGRSILPADPGISPHDTGISTTTDKEHMPALDGLRGLAAAIVLFSHLHLFTGDTDNLGRGGVLLFFALSGFLMAHLHLRQSINAVSVRRFCAARIARIVPLYYSVVILGYLSTQVLGLEAFSKYDMDTLQLARLLLFVGKVSVFWSVGPEFQFYGFFVLIWAITALSGVWRTYALVALGVFAVACYLASPTLPGILFVSKLQIFMVGIAAAMLRWWLAAHYPLPGAGKVILQLAACAGILALVMPSTRMFLPLFPAASVAEHSRWYYADLPRVLLAGLAVLAFSYSTWASNQLLGNWLMRELGRVSFSIYLLHEPVIGLMRVTGFFEDLNPWVAAALCLTLSALVSSAVNRLFETPARIWLSRKLAAPRQLAAAPAIAG
ncbi:putative acyltransferase [Pseudoxanthomonas spadix BD-a59]|jgi:peptidoglycan/LPS O-acetylase OafA/YrhL|uniref:Acyltransferase n=1 Tax=Pseudoxanthomonas spadix (strain BD-a59) TaxID=1045855 RepID=G7UVW5_PSEUP|nr:acyltransferase [Pseudoxanthomonas spadix]AER56434.1 putative acyltransferase [Pseudoxanthomonas spadix BD-a59]